MKHLSTLHAMNTNAFTFNPPQAIYGQVRVLIIGGATVQRSVLAEVIRGFWRFTPHTRVLVAQHPTLEENMLGANMSIVDLETIPMRPYLNKRPDASVKMVTTSTLISDVSACFTVVSLNGQTPTESPSMAILRGLSPTPADPVDAFFTFGQYFGGAIVDCGDKVLWGDDLLDVDRAVYRHFNAEPTEDLQTALTLRKQKSTAS